MKIICQTTLNHKHSKSKCEICYSIIILETHTKKIKIKLHHGSNSLETTSYAKDHSVSSKRHLSWGCLYVSVKSKQKSLTRLLLARERSKQQRTELRWSGGLSWNALQVEMKATCFRTQSVGFGKEGNLTPFYTEREINPALSLE